jgi:amino acid transporter
MTWKNIFAKKHLEILLAEMEGEQRLRRVLGPVGLTSLGVGCIIGAGIFVLTGVAAADNAGPAIMISFCIAAVGCALAAFCYAEFAAMAPVAGSAYTYAYATLGEIFAWIIGWDLILEYSMGCAAVASAWSRYFNEFLRAIHVRQVPQYLCYDPFTSVEGLVGRPWFNLPAIIIVFLVTIVLVVGIRESARTNSLLVAIKVGVVLFVIALGAIYVQGANWTGVPVSQRVLPQERVMPQLIKDYCHKLTEPARVEQLTKQLAAVSLLDWSKRETEKLKNVQGLNPATSGSFESLAYMIAEPNLPRKEIDRALVAEMLPLTMSTRPINVDFVDKFMAEQFKDPDEPNLLSSAKVDQLTRQLSATYRIEWAKDETRRLQAANRMSDEEAEKMLAGVQDQSRADLPKTDVQRAVVEDLLPGVREEGEKKAASHWGILGMLGLNQWLVPLDDFIRGPFAPYGLSGIMVGAAIVFFAYIGFDSISTHAEEARSPQRDVPIGILVSLFLCTILYIAVAAVITGMMKYPDIDTGAPIAAAFSREAAAQDNPVLWAATGLIAAGGLAGMTSVLLVLFLSQARIFMAMSRDGLLPRVFGTVHPRFRTPHLATMMTGAVICLVTAFTPIHKLAEMVNVGTLMAFIMVCAAVWILRYQRPNAKRPFRCPMIGLVAPAGILVNFTLMLFLPLDTWLRLAVWLVLGLAVYFLYSRSHSLLTSHLQHELQMPLADESGNAPATEM